MEALANRAHAVFDALRGRGWAVRLRSEPRELLPRAVADRYPNLSPELVRTLASIEVCCNARETAWILTADDYAKVGGPGFRWNEVECLALEEAADDGERVETVRAFWDRHFPFALAVHSDYDYFAVALETGAIVHGSAPDWDDPSLVAASFDAMLEALASEARATAPRWPFSLLLT